ncbi:MAG: metal-dependent transcriptional regulator [Saprospiraceae bacterium]|nr:metal-dependent transcriptional regulator [Saprospiraceae bacterium]
MLSTSEENYLKALYKIAQVKGNPVSTNDLADELSTSAASVTDMIKKLFEKKLVDYQRYQGAVLTSEGGRLATELVRRHRLWECFLVEKLGYGWDEVHDLAEQLEHIKSVDLVDRLEEYLQFPRFDPHGDPIPDRHGKFTIRSQQLLCNLSQGDRAEVVGVALHDSQFLRFLGEMHLEIGCVLEVLEVFEYDSSMRIHIVPDTKTLISSILSKNIYVKKYS